MVQKFDKKIRGLHKRIKTDMEENSGKVKADLGLLQSDKKITSEKILQIEELLGKTTQELKPVMMEFYPTIEDIQSTL